MCNVLDCVTVCHDIGEMSLLWHLNCDLSLFFLVLCCLLSVATACHGSTFEVLVGSSLLLLCFGWDFDVYYVLCDLKKAYDSVRREVLYNILMEFGIPKKLIRLIKMCLTKICVQQSPGRR
jgi:hypothetical protein